MAVDEEGEPLSVEYNHSINIELAIGIRFQELEGAMSRSDIKEQYIAKRVIFNRIIVCSDWEGSLKGKDGEIWQWDVWDGQGEVIGNTGTKVDIFPWASWQSTGIVIINSWKTWNRTGFEIKPTQLSIHVPARIKNGEFMRVK